MVFVLAFLAGIVFLQIFLSKRESKWPGLILPIISFSVALLYLLKATEDVIILGTIVGFMLWNIPTVILLGIYLVCRETHRHKKQLEKMIIQDLD